MRQGASRSMRASWNRSVMPRSTRERNGRSTASTVMNLRRSSRWWSASQAAAGGLLLANNSYQITYEGKHVVSSAATVLMMASWLEVGRLEDIPRLSAREVRTARGDGAVFRANDDHVFALDDRWPHKGGPLSQGIVFGHTVAGPLHNWCIELASGFAVAPDEGRTRAHAVKGEDGIVYLQLPGAGTAQLGARMAAVRTTYPYCGVGCGVLATPGVGYDVVIQGDDQHPANFGRLCSKGSALGETVDLDGRLLHPQINGARASWDAALAHVAAGFRRIIEHHGPEAVAFYVSGQLLSEDYYVANKLMKGFIGSANIDTNSRLCMASSVAGHKRAFGSDTVPGNYEDLEQAERLVLVGSNTAWCHPGLFQRMRAAREKANRPCKLIVIDPRRTATCDGADLHLPLNPGSDAVLFNGLLTYLFQNGSAWP